MQTSLNSANPSAQTEFAKQSPPSKKWLQSTSNLLPSTMRLAKCAFLMLSLSVAATGCRSTLQQPAGQGNAWQQALESGFTSNSESNTKPHPLSQQLRPGGRSPALRKSMADKRRLTRPPEEFADEEFEGRVRHLGPEKPPGFEGDGARGSLSDDEAEMLSDFAEPQQSGNLTAREQIEREMRRRSRMPQSGDIAESEGNVVESIELDDASGESYHLGDMPDNRSRPRRGGARSKAGGVTLGFSDSESKQENRLRANDEVAPPLAAVVPESQLDDDQSVVSSTSAPVVSAGATKPFTDAEASRKSPLGTGSAVLVRTVEDGRGSPDLSELGWTELGTALLNRLDDEYASAATEQARIDIEKKKRLINVVLDDLSSAQTPIEGLRPEAQEYIRQTLQGLYDATSEDGHPSVTRKLTQALESHRRAMEELTSVASLRVENLAFCTEVDSFGVVKKFENYRFQPKQEVLLYCELQNFASRKMENGFETRLQGSYEIIDTEGRQVFEQSLPEDTDNCANRRRDFYIAYRLYMPDSIKPGAYQLRLYIEDLHGRKFGQSEVDFRVGR